MGLGERICGRWGGRELKVCSINGLPSGSAIYALSLVNLSPRGSLGGYLTFRNP